MSSQYKTKEFLELKKKWDEKLKSSGLENIEQEDGNLKKWSNSFYSEESSEIVRQAKEEYYRLATQVLHSYPFKKTTHQFIWEQHSNGVSVRDIAKALRKRRLPWDKNKVHAIVQAIAKEMIGKCSKRG